MDWFLAIVALCLVIIVHEAGHYFAAVWTGMKVDTFSVFGLGPPLVRLGTWRGTEFIIGVIPFGAYVMIHGMEPEDANPSPRTEPRPSPSDSPNFRDKPLWSRFFVLSGGPAANYLFAMLIFFGVYAAAGAETVQIGAFAEVSAARDAGLEVGDQFLTIGDKEINPREGANAILDASKEHLGETVAITVLRDGETIETTVRLPDQAPALGIEIAMRPSGRDVPLTEAMTLAVARPLAITRAQLTGLYQLVTGQLEAEMSGPVGIVKFIKQSAEAGLLPFLWTAAIISTLLGMFNLLPIPALDGGRLMFVGYEAITRKPASTKVEGLVHGIGMLALLVLLTIVTIGDLSGS